MNINIIIYTAYLILAFSTVYCSWNFRRLGSEFKIVGVYVFLSAGIQVGSEVLAQMGINNLALSHLYGVLGFAVLTLFYRILLRPFIPGLVFSVLIVGFLLLAAATVVWWEPLNTFNSIPLTAEAAVFIILALSTFVLMLNEDLNEHLRPLLRSLNWINSGIFVYFAGSILLFFNGEVILHAIVGRWSVYTWLVHAVLSMILHTCLLMGLWRSPKV